MCGGLHSAAGNLRFDSFLTAENVVLMLIYEVGSWLEFRVSDRVLGSSCPVIFAVRMRWRALQQLGGHARHCCLCLQRYQ